jgi:hypothetical protein
MVQAVFEDDFLRVMIKTEINSRKESIKAYGHLTLKDILTWGTVTACDN